MATKIIMPKLGLNMKEGLIVEWLVEEGADVKKGQPLLTVETDKVVNEVESEAEGILRQMAEAGDSVPVAEVVAYVLEPGEELPEDAGRDVKKTTGTKSEPAGGIAAEKTPAAPVQATGGRILASPKAKMLAKELGVDIATVSGSGPNGRISVEDVERAAAGTSADTKGGNESLGSIRMTIARNMAKSSQETASVTLMCEADATALAAKRDALNKNRPEDNKISFNAMFVKLVATALKEYPRMNASVEGSALKIKEAINVGLAVDSEKGLIVPVIKDAGSLSLEEVNTVINKLADDIKSSRYTQDDVSGNSFTITNLGAYGIDYFTPIINLPDMAVLGIGRIAEKPVAVDGEVKVRKNVFLSLTFDHRWVDGAPAARFLNRIAAMVTDPGSIS